MGGDNFEAAEAGAVARGGGAQCDDRITGQGGRREIARRQALEHRFLVRSCRCVHPFVHGRAQLVRQEPVQIGRGASGARRHLEREQIQDDAILVGRPHRAIASQERRARALLAAKPERAVHQTVHEPLEPDRHFDQRAADLLRDAIDRAAAHQRFANRGVCGPRRPVGEQVEDRGREIVIGIHQAGTRRHDAVTVGIGVVAESDIEAVFERDHVRHRIR